MREKDIVLGYLAVEVVYKWNLQVSEYISGGCSVPGFWKLETKNTQVHVINHISIICNLKVR